MINGIRLSASPTNKQQMTINQWFGCSRFIRNAKCEENDYLLKYAKKYLPVGTYPYPDQTFSQYQDKTLTPWLFDCPSQILRNSASNWYHTYNQFLKGHCNKPKKKRKTNEDSVHLTKELFKFEKCPDEVVRLFIGTKTNNIGYLSIKTHKNFKEPNSIYLKRKNNRYFVSFCYEDNKEDSISQKEHFKYLHTLTEKQLEKITVGIDRGVTRPVQAGEDVYDFTLNKRKKRAIKLILHSGTELSKQGVLLDIERGAINKTQGAKANCGQSKETLKKKGKATFKVA